ncbi:pickpocket protein 28-like [Eupeodes corollae]|uniref:pickpocket protein 28-like n=1 Tax=Eupeodes corollae TaxID=290404 RepID=UPI0024937932|nr:pickpocket protein 28-like [Eupeodes corollae]
MKNQPRRRRVSKARTLCSANVEEFCKNTTLHGLKYIVEKDLNIFERIYFLVSIVFVMMAAGYFISNVYSKWQNTPVIVGLSAKPNFITKSPFPAVTICNLNQAMKSKAMNFTNDSLENSMLQMLCNREVSLKYSNSVKDWTILEDFIEEVSQPCNKMLLACRFGGIDYKCQDIFQPILTDEGLCCSFNVVHAAFMFIHRDSLSPEQINDSPFSDGSVPVDWDPERGYPNLMPRRFYPRVAAGTGESLGFSVVLNVDLEEYYCSSASGPGFKISLHSPTETPQLRETGLLLQPGYETKVRINAVKSEAGTGLRYIRRKHRQCIFNDESKLIYYRFYTKRNCEMECDAKLMYKNCNCVTFYMPKVYPNVSRCGIRDRPCVEGVMRRSHVRDEQEMECHDFCLPSCFDLTFLPDFFSAPISHKGFSIQSQLIQNMSNQYASQNIAVVNMYFKENTFRSSYKQQFIGITDFLSNTGGLMGLFMGFSFISLAELVYFAFMRPFHRFFQQRVNKSPTIIRIDDPQPRPKSQTRLQLLKPLDYTTLNKRNYNYRSRLVNLSSSSSSSSAPLPSVSSFMSNKVIPTNNLHQKQQQQLQNIGTNAQSLMRKD